MVLASPVVAETLRIATFNTELQRKGPGLFLRDITRQDVPDIEEAARRIAHADADIIVLQGIDYDHGQVALSAFAARIADHGISYPHLFSLRPNTGLPTGRDLDRNNRLGEPRDAQGYGSFSGQGGMALLSRFPITGHTDLTGLLWKDLAENKMPKDDPGHDIQRLSTTGHWVVEITPPAMPPLSIMTFHATPPVFDGPEDRNGRRNHDETILWRHFLDEKLGQGAPKSRFILMGDANLDPIDGDGIADALNALLTDPRLQDPAPLSRVAREAALADGGANLNHKGISALDTANWRDMPGPGNLRVDYILPSADWAVIDAGVLWPDPDQALSEKDRLTLSRHGLVWVDMRP